MISATVLCLAGAQALLAETYISVQSDRPCSWEDASTWTVEHHEQLGYAARPPDPNDDVIIIGTVTTDGAMKAVRSLTIEYGGVLQAQDSGGDVLVVANQDIVIREGGCIVALMDSHTEGSGGVCHLEAGRDLVMSGLHSVGISADLGIFVSAQGVVDLTDITAETGAMLSLTGPVVFKTSGDESIRLDPDVSLDSITQTNPVIIHHLEGFEDYDSECTAVFYFWKDGCGYGPSEVCDRDGHEGNGTGAIVGYELIASTEQYTVHGGGHSLPFFYENTGDWNDVGYSEAERAFYVAQNWSRYKMLSLSFHGDANNIVTQSDRLYMALADSTGNLLMVPYDGPVTHLQEPVWRKWDIDLAHFEGIDLTDVRSFRIGIGDTDNLQPGGAGIVFVDDIVLLDPGAFLCGIDFWDWTLDTAPWNCIKKRLAEVAAQIKVAHALVAKALADAALDKADTDLMDAIQAVKTPAEKQYNDALARLNDFYQNVADLAGNGTQFDPAGGAGPGGTFTLLAVTQEGGTFFYREQNLSNEQPPVRQFLDVYERECARQDFQEMCDDLEAARETLDEANDALDELQENLDEAREAYEKAISELEKARADLNNAQRALADCLGR